MFMILLNFHLNNDYDFNHMSADCNLLSLLLRKKVFGFFSKILQEYIDVSHARDIKIIKMLRDFMDTQFLMKNLM